MGTNEMLELLHTMEEAVCVVGDIDDLNVINFYTLDSELN